MHTLPQGHHSRGGLTREAGTTSTAAAIDSLGDCAERPWKPRLQAAWPGRPHPSFPRVTSARHPDQHPGRHVPGMGPEGKGPAPLVAARDRASAAGLAVPHPVFPGPRTPVPCRGLHSWTLLDPPGASYPPPSGFILQPRVAPSCSCSGVPLWGAPGPRPGYACRLRPLCQHSQQVLAPD